MPLAPIDSRFPRIQFTPRLIPTLAALIALGLTLYLGNWQQGRANEKRGLQAQYDAHMNLPPLSLNSVTGAVTGALYRRAQVVGEYDPAGQLFVDNKFEGMTVGYHVFTPMKIADTTRFVLVNRGFVGRGTSYPTPPAVPVPPGAVDVTGMLVSPTKKFLELGATHAPDSGFNPSLAAIPAGAIQGSVWQNITVERYRAQTNRDVLPFVLLASPTDPGLTAQVERPDARVEKHVEYMLTWYSLAATVVVLWLSLNLKFGKPTI